MAELPERDAALLLDMLFAAPDAQAFVEGLDETGFLQALTDRCNSISGARGIRF